MRDELLNPISLAAAAHDSYVSHAPVELKCRTSTGLTGCAFFPPPPCLGCDFFPPPPFLPLPFCVPNAPALPDATGLFDTPRSSSSSSLSSVAGRRNS